MDPDLELHTTDDMLIAFTLSHEGKAIAVAALVRLRTADPGNSEIELVYEPGIKVSDKTTNVTGDTVSAADVPGLVSVIDDRGKVVAPLRAYLQKMYRKELRDSRRAYGARAAYLAGWAR